jgi:fermentation-respiration switch protein FrsA (DUF1100 family)
LTSSPRTWLVIAIVAVILLILGACGCYVAGSALMAPARSDVGVAPPDLAATNIEFDGVRGWFIRGAEGAPCVLLMHGVRSDRRSMIERARMLREAGYSSLLFDFQAHGESPGLYITFGHVESANARAAVHVLRNQLGCRSVAAIGQSLGGAAALLGDGPIQVDALVLESVYPTIEEAVANRLQLRFGRPGAALAPLFTLQVHPRLGVELRSLRPISRVSSFHRPLLVIAGTEDRHTRIEEARRLYEAANEPRDFWAVQGAAHVDLQRFAPEAYRERVLAFLAKNLQK